MNIFLSKLNGKKWLSIRCGLLSFFLLIIFLNGCADAGTGCNSVTDDPEPKPVTNDPEPTPATGVVDTVSPTIAEQTFSIFGDVTVGTTVGTVAATDDSGSIATYAITAGNTGDAFAIDNSGQLTTAAALDYDTLATYSLTVEVTDGSGNTASATITVNVTESDTTDPTIAEQTFSIAENVTVGTTVGTVAATDDSGNIASYTITAGNTGDAFAIDNSGQLTTAAALDYDTLATYSLTVEVTDGSGNMASATITVNVTESTPPTISAQSFSIAEDIAIGSNVGTVLATDNSGSIASYTITAGNTGGAFAIDNSGQLTTAAALDYETLATYSLTVEVADANGNTASATITVDVTDQFLINLFNITDNITYFLERPRTIASINVDVWQSYVYIGSETELGMSVFRMWSTGSLNYVRRDRVSGKNPRSLSAYHLVQGTTERRFLAVARDGTLDGIDDLALFTVNNTDGTLSSIGNGVKTDDGSYRLLDVNAIVMKNIGAKLRLYTAASGNSPDTIESMWVGTNRGSLNHHAEIRDNDTLNMDGISDIIIAESSGTNYLIAAGHTDDGVSVFSIAENNGALNNVTNVSDSGSLELDGADCLAAARVGTTTYVFVGGKVDDGISVFRLNADGTLTSVYNLSDTATLELDGVGTLNTTTYNSTVYLIAGSEVDDGVSVFSVGVDGTLASVQNIADTSTLKLNNIRDMDIVTIGSKQFLFVLGYDDNGFSVFELD